MLLLAVAAACGSDRLREGDDVVLKGPFEQLGETFTYVTSVRELSDGAVIVTDPREQKIVLGRFGDSLVQMVGRRGAGPEEWSTAVALHPLGGDSSVQADPTTRRLIYFDGSRVAASAPPEVATRAHALGMLQGASADGSLFSMRAPAPSTVGPRDLTPNDSLALVRIATTSDRADTIAMLRDAPGRVHARREADGTFRDFALSRPAMAVSEIFAVFPDGWVAIARLEPYRVDWIDSFGQMHLGEPIPIVPRMFDARTREQYLARHRRAIEQLETAPAEVREVLGTRYAEFPREVPPFDASSLVAGMDGRLYVRRAEPGFASHTRYDVVDRTGALARLALPSDARLVTATREHLYVVRRDSLDVEYLRR